VQGPPAPGHTADVEAPVQADMQIGPRFSLTDQEPEHAADSPPVVGKSKVRGGGGVSVCVGGAVSACGGGGGGGGVTL
jgi:hypothetical protein